MSLSGESIDSTDEESKDEDDEADGTLPGDFFRKKMSIFDVLNSRHEITMKSPPSFTIKTQHVHGPPFKLSRNRGNILSAPYFFYL
jgi:hypothetical protein